MLQPPNQELTAELHCPWLGDSAVLCCWVVLNIYQLEETVKMSTVSFKAHIIFYYWYKYLCLFLYLFYIYLLFTHSMAMSFVWLLYQVVKREIDIFFTHSVYLHIVWCYMMCVWVCALWFVCLYCMYNVCAYGCGVFFIMLLKHPRRAQAEK